MPSRVTARSAALAVLLAVAAALAPFRAARADAQPAPDCADPPTPIALGSAQWNGWGRGVENTRYQPEPAIRAMDVSKLALKWAFGYPGDGLFGQAAIVDGRLFVATSTGRVYSLDAKSGCIYWSFDAQAGVRTAISIAELAVPRQPVRPKKKSPKHAITNAHLDVQKAPSAAVFGDDRGAVYAVETEHGTLLWKTQVDAHPTARIRAAPMLYQDRLIVAVDSSEADAAKDPAYDCCTFRGSVAALDVATGRLIWKTYLVSEEPRDLRAGGSAPANSALANSTPGMPARVGSAQFGPAGVPIAAAPTIDAARARVYVATGDSFNPAAQPLADAVVALDLADGKIRWAKQLAAAAPSEFDASPILRTLANGKQSLLASQKSGMVYSLDPERDGEVLWQLKAPGQAPGGVVWGAAADHRSVYVALSGRSAVPANPFGSFTAVDIKTGARRWQTDAPTPACSWRGEPLCSHAQAQAVTVIPGAAFSGSIDGHLRAYSTIDGKILWDYDTAKEFTTLEGLEAAGGSLDAGGPTIVNGVVYINSGGAAGEPGNVLLAFSVDGK
jgi:polyvinyl alcohol dehydrogenase (cytochrome)